MDQKDVVARAIRVKRVPIGELRANPHNPRMLFDQVDLQPLEDSIRRVGILVPLIVYREAKTGHYRILDGQRRWICAEKLRLSDVPVNEVEEPSLVQNIVTMFQIHRLRKDWELMPTALKLGLLIDTLNERSARRLAALTALDEAVVVRCKKLLSYPKKYQDMMLGVDPKKRLKADFFIELYAVLHDRVVKSFEWFHANQFTDAMLRKYEAGVIRTVTDFRIVKGHINNAAKARRIGVMSRRLREFAENVNTPIERLNIESASVIADGKRIVKVVEKLYAELEEMDVDDYVGEREMWDRLQALARLVRRKLKALGYRSEQ